MGKEVECSKGSVVHKPQIDQVNRFVTHMIVSKIVLLHGLRNSKLVSTDLSQMTVSMMLIGF